MNTSATRNYVGGPHTTGEYPVADPGFPRGGGVNPQGGGANLLFGQNPENCMKRKEFGPQGRGHASLALLRSVTGIHHVIT